MVSMDELLDHDLDVASRVAAGVVPDSVAALDRLAPLLFSVGGNCFALRRYYSTVDAAAQTLAELPVNDHERITASPAMVYRLLQYDLAELAWVAPAADGLGVLTALVDRIRGFVGGLPQQCTKPRDGIDEQRLCWFMESMSNVQLERRHGSPLRRAMQTLGLSSSGMAALMGVTRQAVDKWLLAGPPAERMGKIATVASIADILRYRLRDGMPAVVARRPAEAYGGRSMIEVITDDEHEWLHRAVQESFDFALVT